MDSQQQNEMRSNAQTQTDNQEKKTLSRTRKRKAGAMTEALRNMPIKRRLAVIGVIVAASVVLLAALGFGGWALYSYFRTPTLQLLGGADETVEVFSPYTDPGVRAQINGENIAVECQTSGKVDSQIPGTYELSYTLKYHLRTYHLKRMVRVADTTPPVLTLNGDKELSVGKRELYQEPGYSAVDNFDGDITARVQVRETSDGDNVVFTYTVCDSSGNETSAQRTVRIADLIAPQIALNGAEYIQIEAGNVFSDPGVCATDETDGDLSALVTVSGMPDCGVPGVYTVCYTVQDRAGNTAVAERTVEVCPAPTNSANRIYLTFDDGPSSFVTEQVLDILKKNGIQATFFICNFSDALAPLVKRMADEEHAVAIHGYSHDYSAIYTSEDAFMQNVYQMQQRIFDVTGVKTTLMRFPGGSSNTISARYSDGIMSRLVGRVEKEGFSYFDWNIDSTDASANTQDRNKIIQNVMSGLRQGRENIVLMHDTNAKTTTAEALQSIIDRAKAQGYVFLPLSAATQPVHHGVNN